MCAVQRWNYLLFHVSELSTVILDIRSFKHWNRPGIGHLVSLYRVDMH